ncbi:sulfite exporter TauE/SafE family protein [Clostridium sp. D2Q-11]|uniref:Probable membrane transporter protein n=1 Tax=Anaeromonas frigoriresistens TaxID=2683708 RepID=A0A942V1W0_9FIRM|nr:sulfite exporter TauE/SafE family protein [Anaeromonas frigoriresistens]MBS4539637.1 sulfite exporter TauE/SafE family protein [Anaeromonas frigoriresistens]
MKLILIGFLSGILGGMGIGGGTILIPALIFFVSITQQQAQGINLIVFIPTSIIAIFIHYKNKNLETKIILPIIITGLVGSIFGSIVATKIEPENLRKIFGVFMLLIGIYQFFNKK